MQSLTRDTIRIYWKHTAKYKGQFFTLASCTFLAVMIELVKPFLFKYVIDTLASTEARDFGRAIFFLLIWEGTEIIRTFIRRYYDLLMSKFQPQVMADINNSSYKYLLGHSYNFFNNNFVGSLVTKVKRFERSFETISDTVLYDLGQPVLMVLITMGIFFWKNTLLGGIVLVWVILYLTANYFFIRYKLPFDLKKAKAETSVTGQLADSITNSQTIKLFSGWKREKHRFAELVDKHRKIRMFTWTLNSRFTAFQSGSMILLEFVLLYFSITQWRSGVFTVGDVVFIQIYMDRIFQVLWNITRKVRSLYEAIADANEMTEILTEEHSIKDAVNATELSVHSAQIDFDKVTFSYNEGSGILKNFSLHITPSEKVAFVGPSGGGKSTIIKLLFRLFDIQKGTITIDGQNIADITQESLRYNVSLVPQDPILFHRTLLENIRYAKPDATKEEVVEAAKAAHCHEFISTFPEGYETYVGERGVKLSGGERQRVAIARAILKNAPILVLDEATSSLDSESERLIQDALHTLMKGKTVIVVAHRLSTIMQMDRILVIENGTVTESGTHSELLHLDEGMYQKLWQIQAGSFV